MDDFTYSIALFLHIGGALGLFAALGLEWTGLRQIRNAVNLGQIGSWMGILKKVRKVGFASMLATVITGIYMMLTDWGPVAWIVAAMASLVLVIALSLALTGPRMAAIGRALATVKGPSSQSFHSLANHPLLWVSIQTRVAITLGIVFLKTVKPDLVGSLLTVGAAIVLGLATALPIFRHERAQEAPAD